MQVCKAGFSNRDTEFGSLDGVGMRAYEARQRERITFFGDLSLFN